MWRVGPALLVLGMVSSASAQISTYGATTDSHDSTWNRSRRVKQTRVVADDRTIETKVVEEPSINGGYALLTATEKETIQVRTDTIRVVERLYVRDQNGHRQLSRMAETETTTVPGKNKTTVRTWYESDVNGNLKAMERQTEESIPLNASTNRIVSSTFRMSGGAYVRIHQTVTLETRNENADIDVKSTNSFADSGGESILGAGDGAN
jgi:hypothetical protein